MSSPRPRASRLLWCAPSALSALLSCAETAHESQDFDKNEKHKSIEESNDFCLALGWYGDGHCDLVCDQPDLDCQEGAVDPAALPEYSVTEDVCATRGYYGDGECDSCPQPDPDCQELPAPPAPPPAPPTDLATDPCAVGWDFDDGYCDPFCVTADPDCAAPALSPEERDAQTRDAYGGDPCLDLSWYGNGVCDSVCLDPDPDCAQEDPPPASPPPATPQGDAEEDLCARLGYYGDAECDRFCDLPDPDCE